MKISGGDCSEKEKKGKGSVEAVNGLWHEYLRLSASRLLSPEESDAMAAFLREMRALQDRLASGLGLNGYFDRDAGHAELDGMIRIVRDDIDLVRMRKSM